ncbi:MAG TPA: class I SAM-dependent methyltransferase [Candidatus Acidoferrales bacterium]|nr:class I SAM-dependent methyltransferase [Candidatus Acidoferrales bacterium]
MNQTQFEWTPDFWQGWRESKSPYRRYKSMRDRQLVLKALALRDGDRVLEVGCGYGWISQALWEAARIDWFGVDRSAEMIRSLHKRSSPGTLRALIADACRLPFRNDQFDKVLCTGVLMHIAEDQAAVQELARVLRPGGVLVCSINNTLSPYSLPVRLWNQRKSGFVQKFRRPAAFRRLLRDVSVQPTGMAGDGIIATVPLAFGPIRFPPESAFRMIRGLDEWAANRFAWLAYEVWFRGIKAAAPGTL